MIAVILAAGYATRMYPLTENFPKPLLEVQGKTILDWLVADLDGIPEISEIRVVSNHKFIAHFRAWASGAAYRAPISVLDDGSVSNETRLGAVRDICFAMDGADSDALVLAGDNLLEFSLRGFVNDFNANGHSEILCYREPSPERQRKTGIITLDERRKVTSFEEKPAQPKSDWAVPPFYAYTRADIRRIPQAIRAGCAVDAPGSLAAWLSRESEVYAWPMPGKRHDIGSLEGYRAVQSAFQKREGN